MAGTAFEPREKVSFSARNNFAAESINVDENTL
jgi:hypothetical protein